MTVGTKRGKGILVVVAFAAFFAVLLFAFFFNRSSDVGQLTRLVGDSTGGPLFGKTIADSIYGTVTAIIILVSWLGLGSILDGLIDAAKENDSSEAMYFVRSTAIGAAVWSVAWFFLGIAGLYNATTVVACTILGILLALFGVFHYVEIVRQWPKKPSASTLTISIIITIPVFLTFIASLAPPIAKDTLLYHFAVPQTFVAHHSSAIIEGNIASYLTMGTEMHTVWAMLLGAFYSDRAGEAAAGATSFLFLPLLLMAVYGWARMVTSSRSWSLIAVLIVATIPTVYHVASSGYIDISLALYVTLATYALSRWWQSQEKGWIVLIAIFLGAALSIKLTALFTFAAFALIILLRARKEKDGAGKPIRILAHGFIALVLAVVIASPWLVRTWHATGSPVFPFYMSILPAEAPGWDVERSNLFQAMNSRYGGVDKSPLDYLLAPWNLSVAAQPEQPEYFDGVLGVAFLFGLPILVCGLWKFDLPVAAKICGGVAGIMFLFWLFSSQQMRYLLPIVPLLTVAIAAAAEKVSIDSRLRQVLRYSFVLAGVLGILVIAAWFLRTAPVRVVLGGETRDDYLTRNLDYYPYYQWINNETGKAARVWLINMRRDTYHIDRPVFSDYFFEDWTLREMVWSSANAQEMRAKAAALGIKYVLTRHDFLFDYERSTLVDDKKPLAVNEAKLRIARDFILDKANTVRADEKFSLIKVF